MHRMYIECPVFFALPTTEEASHSWGETFGDQKCHRLVCGKLLENHHPARITQKLYSIVPRLTCTGCSLEIRANIQVVVISIPCMVCWLTSTGIACKGIQASTTDFFRDTTRVGLVKTLVDVCEKMENIILFSVKEGRPMIGHCHTEGRALERCCCQFGMGKCMKSSDTNDSLW